MEKVRIAGEEEKEDSVGKNAIPVIPPAAEEADNNILKERRCNIQQQTFNDRRASVENFFNELHQ